MHKNIIQIPVSLIKYEAPIPILNKQAYQKSKNQQIHQGKTTVRDILNVLLPPRQFNVIHEEKQIIYLQYVESNGLSREDVDNLKQKIQGFLKVQKARQQPLCPIRQKIYSQAFDQLIRQVIIDCPQRGIMLNRVKNQSFLTIAAYRTVYEQSISFSRQKLLQSQNGLTQLQEQQRQLLQKQKILKQKQHYLLAKKQSIQQKNRQIKTIYKQKRGNQASMLLFQHQHLKHFVQQMNRIKQQQKQKLIKQKKKQKNNDSDSDDDLPQLPE